MPFYLRFTDSASHDVERGTSYHTLTESDLEELFEKYETRDIDGMKDRDGKNIISWGGGEFSSAIGGLCGYKLGAGTLEEAIEEAGNGYYPYDYYGAPVIFDGLDTGIRNVFEDGEIFKPIAVLHILERAGI